MLKSRRRIPRDLVDEALDCIDEEEYADAASLIVRRKAQGMDRPLSREDALKVARFAMGRGFEWKYIKRALDGLKNGDEEDF